MDWQPRKLQQAINSPDLTNPEIRRLKAAVQHLEPVVRVGNDG
jgi:hypothetical protein